MGYLPSTRKTLVAILVSGVLVIAAYLALSDDPAPPGSLPPHASEEPSTPALISRQDAPQRPSSLTPRTSPSVSPQAILDFAHQIAGLMQDAFESEEAAQLGFEQLELCAEGSEASAAIQARLICLANAERLAEEYPDALGARLHQLESRHPKLVAVARAKGL